MSLRALLDQHTHIGLDLDEVLAASMIPALAHLHEKGLAHAITSFDHIHQFDWENIPDSGLSKEFLHEFWKTHDYNTALPSDGARSVVEKLSMLGKNLSVVTARESWYQKERSLTWISEYFPQVSLKDVHFADHFSGKKKAKSVLCREYWISLMFEDAVHNAEDLVTSWITTLLLEKPWNRNIAFEHPLLYRVKDWYEIEEALS